ncbi:P-loop containing nucleoside triphosphate hydrolase protein [Hesseltinella vesiculosa]|uniref:P-loop containing nucleoside triphosphate hydrolase protein n=1 Tax=Hesseltinella vesiculosa TaxID=101127 RepID=A0A1X2GTN8_9FUNG|nr:P-loop containing nucleoside triphosphate hydrolase protein [Hesseltinella vesiculosa]
MRVITVGISGPTCSGKTTITRVLQQLAGRSVIVYQDDYFKPESKIPIDAATNLANWDCPEALDFDQLVSTIQYVQQHGQLPEAYASNEVENTHDGSTLVPAATMAAWRQQLEQEGNGAQQEDTVWLIVDGFMLVTDARVRGLFDYCFFVTASYATLKERRERRQGYHTLEGYWVDPPGYFDTIVWPEYLRAHRHLLDDQDHPKPSASSSLVVIDTDHLAIREAIQTTLHVLWPQLTLCR